MHVVSIGDRRDVTGSAEPAAETRHEWGVAQWICQKPVKAAKTLGMFSSPESLNSA